MRPLINYAVESIFSWLHSRVSRSYRRRDSCVSIKYLNYWSSEMSSVTIKSRIKSYLLFYFYVFDEGTPEAELLERERPLSRALTSCYEASGSHPNFVAQSVHLHFCTGMSDIPLYVSLVELVFACSKYIGRIPRRHSIYVHKRSHWRTRRNRNEEIQILYPHPLTTKLLLERMGKRVLKLPVWSSVKISLKFLSHTCSPAVAISTVRFRKRLIDVQIIKNADISGVDAFGTYLKQKYIHI